LGNSAVTHVRPGGVVGACDLGTAANPWGDIHLAGSIVGGAGAWVYPTPVTNTETRVNVRSMRYRLNGDRVEVEGSWKYKSGFNLGVGFGVNLFTLSVGYRPDNKVNTPVTVIYETGSPAYAGCFVNIWPSGVVQMINSTAVAISETMNFSISTQFALV
jgi:hypothetical protein